MSTQKHIKTKGMAKNVKDGEQWKMNTQGQQQKDVRTMCYGEPPHPLPSPARPFRPARYPNGVKLDDDEVASIA